MSLEEKRKSRRVSATYQILIVAGFIILFIQLYAFAAGMYRDAQSTEQIERYETKNQDLKDSIKETMVSLLKNQLQSVEIRTFKETFNKRYLDEEVRVIKDSELLAKSEVLPSQKDVFKDPEAADYIDAQAEALARIKLEPKINHWKYFLFHIE